MKSILYIRKIIVIGIFICTLITANTLKINAQILKFENTPPPPLEEFTKPYTKATEANAVIIKDVPHYGWSYGCWVTSAAMVFGYYDRQGYPQYYLGEINNGYAPINNSFFGIHDDDFFINPICGSKNGVDGRNVDGHDDDFWDSYGGGLGNDPDPWSGGSPPHDFEVPQTSPNRPCIGDLSGSSQDHFNTPDGSTVNWANRDGTRNCDLDITQNGKLYRCGCHGGVLYGNTTLLLADAFSQYIDTYCSNSSQNVCTNSSNGFTFSDFKYYIDRNKPVIIAFTEIGVSKPLGHAVTGVGYEEGSKDYIYYHDPNYNYRKKVEWGGSITGDNNSTLGMYRVEVFDPGPVPGGGTAVGLDDYVYILNVDSLPDFIPGATISLSANFVQGEDEDTYPVSWNWRIELISKDSLYLLCEDLGRPADSYNDTWTVTLPSNIPISSWSRNENCNIDLKITAWTVDNEEYINQDTECSILLEGFPETLNMGDNLITNEYCVKKANNITTGNYFSNSVVKIMAKNSIIINNGFTIDDNTAAAFYIMDNLCEEE